MTCDCVPAVNSKTGEILGLNGARKARQILEEREGPPPFEGAVCRHLCKNDSTAPNGIVCTVHTTWGTRSENMMDKSPQNRTRSASAAGKIGAPIINARPDSPNKVEVACPHCGKTGQKMNMVRWHFDNCKFRNLSGEISEGVVVEGEQARVFEKVGELSRVPTSCYWNLKSEGPMEI